MSNKPIPISKVVRVLLDNTGSILIQNKSEFADILLFPHQEFQQLCVQYNTGNCTAYEFLSKLLINWVNCNGVDNSTVGELTTVLERTRFKLAADCISNLGDPETKININQSKSASNNEDESYVNPETSKYFWITGCLIISVIAIVYYNSPWYRSSPSLKIPPVSAELLSESLKINFPVDCIPDFAPCDWKGSLGFCCSGMCIQLPNKKLGYCQPSTKD